MLLESPSAPPRSGKKQLIFDGDAPCEEQASHPLQKGKGRAATSLGAVPPDKQLQQQKQKRCQGVVPVVVRVVWFPH